MIENFLADARLLQNALAESDSANMIRSDAEKAMNFYGMSAEELSLSDIIKIRTSAERCMNGKLRTLQFSSGNPSESGFKMSKDIYMYRDIDAMLYCAADNVLDGVSLGYIRDEESLLTAILPLSSKTAGIYICLQTSQSTNIRL